LNSLAILLYFSVLQSSRVYGNYTDCKPRHRQGIRICFTFATLCR